MLDNAGVMNCPYKMTENKLEYQSQVVSSETFHRCCFIAFTDLIMTELLCDHTHNPVYITTFE